MIKGIHKIQSSLVAECNEAKQSFNLKIVSPARKGRLEMTTGFLVLLSFVKNIVPPVVKPICGIICIMEIIISCLSFQNLNAQLFFKTPDSDLKVENESKQIFRFPWAGGMNSCQFGEIDLNLDGINDLFVFDRYGDRIMTFLNSGIPGSIDYDYAPEFISKFPDLNDWAILADYNLDGKADIFTKSVGLPGIIVYRNTSLTELSFTLEVYPYLLSFQGGGYVNILVTDVDYPAISDVDNDGDMDILTFWGLGSFVEMHKNLSMEKYGIPDSLDFIKTSNCWGFFAESDEANDIYLDTCVGGSFRGEMKTRHTGSTFLLIDLDNDTDKDLLLGDVDYPNLVQLINGGTTDSAYMVSVDTLFPSYDKPVNLFSMPSAAYIDVDNDAANDLILSPFDPGLTTSQNLKSVWLYLNEGENTVPDFDFETNNFLQNEMIDVGSGAYPVLADYNGDGLQDLFISNYGDYIYSYYSAGNFLHSVYWSNVSLFVNTGTINQPKFNRITHDFINLEQYQLTGLYLTFGDTDGDLDLDMMLGHNEGTVWYFKNAAGQGQPLEFDTPLQSYQNIDVGNYSAPQLFDLNDDGLLDLIVGEENGNLNYYQNTGTLTSPVFSFVTDSLGKVNVTDYQLSYTGYSSPRFFKNFQNETNLLVGSEQGKLFYYKNIDGNLEGEFEENDSLYLIIGNQPFEIKNGIRTGAAIEDVNNDGFFDLFIGNYSGGLNYYSGTESPPAIGWLENSQPYAQLILFPNPAKDYLNIRIEPDNEYDQLKINIYSVLTELVLSETFYRGEVITLKVNQLKPGAYYCTVELHYKNQEITYKELLIVR
jgi:hypothetical protein